MLSGELKRLPEADQVRIVETLSPRVRQPFPNCGVRSAHRVHLLLLMFLPDYDGSWSAKIYEVDLHVDRRSLAILLQQFERFFLNAALVTMPIPRTQHEIIRYERHPLMIFGHPF